MTLFNVKNNVIYNYYVFVYFIIKIYESSQYIWRDVWCLRLNKHGDFKGKLVLFLNM